MSSWSWHNCFFFQAEDGIRDVAVTGVQTCALPICGRDIATHAMEEGADATDVPGAERTCSTRVIIEHQPRSIYGFKITTRSEERRVGKECRSRWSQE